LAREEQQLGYPMNDTRRNLRLPEENEILRRFVPLSLDEPSRDYLRFHANRYAFLLKKVHSIRAARILDIGPSFQTSLMRELYPNTVIDSLGFDDTRFPRRENDRHFDFDLNDSVDPEKWPRPETLYDLVVMAEVLEHVYTAARPVLCCVASLLCDGGSLMIQTPNAVSLGRRSAMARGKKPYGAIREDKKNPGHFCEFTIDELKEAAESANLTVVESTLTNYFGPDGFRKNLYELLCSALPGDLQDGITLIARKV
jgi:Methyltransferase domain